MTYQRSFLSKVFTWMHTYVFTETEIIKSKLSKLPLRFDGKLFSVDHTAVNKAFKHAKGKVGLDDDNVHTLFFKTHSHFLFAF